MSDPDHAEGARQVAHELARMVAHASDRGALPPGFVDQLLSGPDHDGALALLLEAAEAAGGALSADVLEGLAEGLITSPERVRGSRAVLPLLASLSGRPQLAARLLARDDLLDALVGGPRHRGRRVLDLALVRVLEAVAPLRAEGTVAAVVRRTARDDVDLDRLGRGVTTMLVASFDDLAGLALGVGGWLPLRLDELRPLIERLREDPVQLSRLATRCAEHGRASLLVEISVRSDLDTVEESLARAVGLFGLLAPPVEAEVERAAYFRVVTDLMRLTALQLLLAERAGDLPPAVVASWPRDEGRRVKVGRLDRDGIGSIVSVLDRHGLLRVGTPTPIW